MANWYEGGRRITRLFQAIVILGSGAIIFFGRGPAYVSFDTTLPDRNFRLTSERCDSPDRSYTLDPMADLPPIQLCFRAGRNGHIPYRFSHERPVPPVQRPIPLTSAKSPPAPVFEPQMYERYYWTADPYSLQIGAYMRHRAAIFRDADTWQEIARDNAFRATLRSFWRQAETVLPWTLDSFWG